MKKKIITLLIGALILTAAIPSAFAAATGNSNADLNKLYDQIANLRKQMVQKYVDAGEITPDQGKLMQERIDQMQQYRAENGYGPGAGFGRRGFGGGFGGCGGFGGGGFGGCGGWYANGTAPAPAPAPNAAPSGFNANAQGL